MSWKFWKREANPMDPQEMLARGHADSSAPRSHDGRPPQDGFLPQDGFPPQDGFAPREGFPPRPQDALPVGSFGLAVEDVFSITGRGTVATGRVRTGTVSVGEQLIVNRDGQPLLQVEVTGIEMFRRTVKTAKAGDNIGLLLRGIKRDQVLKGDVLSK
ncbi:EF-Tu/IF-2/RF-3 family GTPase [Kribbella solani]|uniref:Translation elongation factor EFTu-like domain-containing protein n=1 Tax=Kribbella solani TaxID=236067 RepID=A0A841DLV8_9ACTN|nr:EF-Tu/IF-2/RF-3 family GTPase [Kribbella solani]MBB5979522.1 hypothetical protein [Kribbella solani]